MDACPKCGNCRIDGPRYMMNSFGQERLIYRCAQCRYETTGPTLDAQKKSAALQGEE